MSYISLFASIIAGYLMYSIIVNIAYRLLVYVAAIFGTPVVIALGTYKLYLDTCAISLLCVAASQKYDTHLVVAIIFAIIMFLINGIKILQNILKNNSSNVQCIYWITIIPVCAILIPLGCFFNINILGQPVNWIFSLLKLITGIKFVGSIVLFIVDGVSFLTLLLYVIYVAVSLWGIISSLIRRSF